VQDYDERSSVKVETASAREGRKIFEISAASNDGDITDV
jgi:hypothetical protein